MPPPSPQVWLPTLPSISGGTEEKLLVVATSRLLADTKQLAAPEANELVRRGLAGTAPAGLGSEESGSS